MIDLGTMRAVRVDPTARTARVQGGALWAELDRETTAFGLATTGGVISATGVAGLTLGGGIGWLVGKHGMSIDNLLSVDLVTADGVFVTASVQSHPDLFWALRGGGGNFGVATSFEFALHPAGRRAGRVRRLSGGASGRRTRLLSRIHGERAGRADGLRGDRHRPRVGRADRRHRRLLAGDLAEGERSWRRCARSGRRWSR